MTNELVNYQAVNMTAKSFFESGLFKDTATQAQAVVKILAGREFGLSPFQAMSALNVINGKVVLTSGFLASKIKSSGGAFDYKIKEFSETVCSIDFYRHGQFTGNFTFTIEDAKRAGIGNANPGGNGKIIDKFPKNMLFARAISNGVKFHIPDLFSNSVYVEGELDGALDEDDNIYDVDVKAFFISKFPKFYSSWELISTLDQMNLAIEKMNLDPKWSKVISSSEFQRLKEMKIKEIQETIETFEVEEEENYLAEALTKVDNSTSREEIEIHEKTYLNLLSGSDKEFFKQELVKKLETLPTERKLIAIQNQSGIPVFENAPETENKLSSEDIQKEACAIDDIEKCQSISDIQKVVTQYNGLKSRSPLYAKSIQDKVNMVAEKLFEEFKSKVHTCRNEKQVTGVRMAYPSFDSYPEWKDKFDVIVSEKLSALPDIKAV